LDRVQGLAGPCGFSPERKRAGLVADTSWAFFLLCTVGWPEPTAQPRPGAGLHPDRAQSACTAGLRSGREQATTSFFWANQKF